MSQIQLEDNPPSLLNQLPAEDDLSPFAKSYGSFRVNPWSQMLCASGVPQSCPSQQQHGPSSVCSSTRQAQASFSIRQSTFVSIDWHASLLGAWTARHRSCYGPKHVFSGTMQEMVVPQSCRSPVGFELSDSHCWAVASVRHLLDLPRCTSLRHQ